MKKLLTLMFLLSGMNLFGAADDNDAQLPSLNVAWLGDEDILVEIDMQYWKYEKYPTPSDKRLIDDIRLFQYLKPGETKEVKVTPIEKESPFLLTGLAIKLWQKTSENEITDRFIKQLPTFHRRGRRRLSGNVIVYISDEDQSDPPRLERYEFNMLAGTPMYSRIKTHVDYRNFSQNAGWIDTNWYPYNPEEERTMFDLIFIVNDNMKMGQPTTIGLSYDRKAKKLIMSRVNI